MKIGIGVTSFNRPAHLDLWVEQITKHSSEDVKVHIEIDKKEDRKGIAFRKNNCLRALKDCDYIFLFDDDCFPIADGWIDFFIEKHKATNQHHFLYMRPTTNIRIVKAEKDINIFTNCGGVFMFLTKEVIKKVGGFCKDYGMYGYEHAGYSHRIHSAGLNTFGQYLSPKESSKYLYAMDYDSYLPFNKQLNHAPSLINEIASIGKFVNQNKVVYLEDIKTINQPL